MLGALWDNRGRGTLMALVVAGTVAALATRHYLLGLLPGLAVLFLLVLERRPTWGYYLIVGLIPFGAYRGLAGGSGLLRFHWVVGVALVLLVLLHWMPRRVLGGRVESKLWPWLGVFLAASLVAALFSPYPGVAYKHVALLVAAYVFVGVSMIFVSEVGFRRTVPAVIVWSVSASALLAVLGYFANIPFFAEKAVTGGFKRGTGAAPDPNNMSLMIIFALPFALRWWFHARSLRGRCLAAGVCFINVLGIVTTYSRGGALVFCLMLVGFLIQYRRRLQPKYLGLMASGVALLGIFTLVCAPASYWDRLGSLVVGSDRAVSHRASYIPVALDAFGERPLVGHGPGAFPQIYAKTEQAERFQIGDESKERYAHNTYLDVLVGSGLVGLAAFAGILCVALRNFGVATRQARARNDGELAFLIGTYRLSFVVLLVYLLLFSDPYHKYLLLSLALSQVALRTAAPRQSEQ